MMSSSTPHKHLRSFLKEAEKCLSLGQLKQAEILYTKAIEIEPSNPNIYGNRSVILTKLGKCNLAISDAERALELDSTYEMGEFHKAMAFAEMQDYNSSLISFSKGLAVHQKNIDYINGIIDVALQSNLKDTLTPILSQLKSMQLEANAFIIVSVVGQELLSHGSLHESIEVLENALQIGTRSLKLKGSVYSALSSALWSLGETDRAIEYMQEDLNVARQLADMMGECRAHGNLGAAYFSQKNYQLARESHNRQLALAQRMNDLRSQLNAWSSIGHVQSAVGDHLGAIESHKHAASLAQEIEDKTARCRELGLLGNCYLAANEITSALQCHSERLRVAMSNQQGESFQLEVQKAYNDVANVYHRMERHENEITCLQKSCDISQHLKDDTAESLTLANLGHVARQTGNLKLAKQTYERLLELALTSENDQQEAKACANLGVIHHQMGDYEMALKLQARNLEIGEACRDVASQGRAHGNIGNAYSAMGLYEQALNHHLKELEISQSDDDKASECSTHGNLAVAYQALNDEENALKHYTHQMELARLISDVTNELRAYLNMANYYSSNKRYEDAIPLYEVYLRVSTSSSHVNKSEVARVNYNLAFAHFSCRHFEDAIKHYDANLELCTQAQDKDGMARSLCNLGLAWKELGETEQALECQTSFLQLSNEIESTKGVFKALGNIGDVYLSVKDYEKSIEYFQQQFDLAKSLNDPFLVAQSCMSLGLVYKLSGDHEKSLKHHKHELQIYVKKNDVKNIYKSHGRLGDVYVLLGDHKEALKHFNEQYVLAKQLNDRSGQKHSLWNIGANHVSLGNQSEAIKHFKEQIKLIEGGVEKGAVLCVIGECYERLANYNEANNSYEECLEYANDCKDVPLLEKAFHGLQSIAMDEKNVVKSAYYCKQRITLCEDNDNVELLVSAWEDLADIHKRESYYRKALECLQKLISLLDEDQMEEMKMKAFMTSGDISVKLHRYYSALEFYKMALKLSSPESINNECKIHGCLGAAYTMLSKHLEAIAHYEQKLFIAEKISNVADKVDALIGIVKNLIRLGTDHTRAVLLLQQTSVLIKQHHLPSLLTCKLNMEHSMAVWHGGDTNLVEGLIQRTITESEEIIARKHDYDFDFMDHYGLIIRCHASLIIFYIATEQYRKALGCVERTKHLPELLLKRGKLFPIDEIDMSVDVMVERCCASGTMMVYYTTISGCLFAWLISPSEGLCAFAKKSLIYEDKNYLSELLLNLRNSLGVEALEKTHDSALTKFRGQKFADTMLTQQILSNDLSMFNIVFPEPDDNVPDISQSKSPIYSLYQLLINPFEAQLQEYFETDHKLPLQIVVDSTLVLVPFSLLKKRANDEFLSRSFQLHVIPSHRFIMQADSSIIPPNVLQRGLVAGNPATFDPGMTSQSAEDECDMVSSHMQVEPCTGQNVTRPKVLSMLQGCEVIHIACPVNWSEPCAFLISAKPEFFQDKEEEGIDPLTLEFETMHSDCYLTLNEIMQTGILGNKMVVIGAPYIQNISQQNEDYFITDMSIVTSQLIAGLSIAGAKSILLPLWPVPVIASKILFHNLHKNLRSGMSCMTAFDTSVDVLRSTEQFQHPSYWAGFLFIGQDVTLDPNNIAFMHALAVLTESNPGHIHDTIRLVLHLVDKSLQRMQAPDVDHSIPMYTTQDSIAKKVHEVKGWRELLSSARFQLRPSANGLPDAVFFPVQEDAPFLQSLKPVLTSFLQLSVSSFVAISRLFNSPLAAARLTKALEEALMCDHAQQQLDLDITRKTWQTDGADDLLITLGFNLSQITDSEVHSICMIEDGILLNIENATNIMKIFFGHIATTSRTDHGRNLSKDFTELTPTNVHVQRQPVKQVTTSTFAVQVSQTHRIQHEVSSNAVNTRKSIVDDLTNVFQNLSGPSSLDGMAEKQSYSPTTSMTFEPKQFTSKPTSSDIIAPKAVFPTFHDNQPNEPADFAATQTSVMFYVDDSVSNQETERSFRIKFRSNSFSMADVKDDLSPRKVQPFNHDRTKSEPRHGDALKHQYTPSPSVARSISMNVSSSRDYRKVVDNFDKSSEARKHATLYERQPQDVNNNFQLQHNLTPSFFTNQFLSQAKTVPTNEARQQQTLSKAKDIPPDVYYTKGAQIQITKNSKHNNIIKPVPIQASLLSGQNSRFVSTASKPVNKKSVVNPVQLVKNPPSNGHIEFV